MGCKCSDAKDRVVSRSSAPIPGNPLLKDISVFETDSLLERNYEEIDQDNNVVCSSSSPLLTSNAAISHACRQRCGEDESTPTNSIASKVKIYPYQRTSPSGKSVASSRSIDEPSQKQSQSPTVVKDENTSDPASEQKKSPLVCQENHIFTCRFGQSPKVDPLVPRVLGIDMLAPPAKAAAEDTASLMNATPGSTLSFVDVNCIESTKENTIIEASAPAIALECEAEGTPVIEKPSLADSSLLVYPHCTELIQEGAIIQKLVPAPDTLCPTEQISEEPTNINHAHIVARTRNDGIGCEVSSSKKRDVEVEISLAQGEAEGTPSSMKATPRETLSLVDPTFEESTQVNTIIEVRLAPALEGEAEDMPSSMKATSGGTWSIMDPKIEESTQENTVIEIFFPTPAPTLKDTLGTTDEVMQELPNENLGHIVAQRHDENIECKVSSENKSASIDVEISPAQGGAEDKPSSVNANQPGDTWSLDVDSEESTPESTIIEVRVSTPALECASEGTPATEKHTSGDANLLVNHGRDESSPKDANIETQILPPVDKKADSYAAFMISTIDMNVKGDTFENAKKNSSIETFNGVNLADTKGDSYTSPLRTTIDKNVGGDALANTNENSSIETFNSVNRDQNPCQQHQDHTAEEYPGECDVETRDSFHASVANCAGLNDHPTKDIEALNCLNGELMRDLSSFIGGKNKSAGVEKEVNAEHSVNITYTYPLYPTRTNGTAEPKIEKPSGRDIKYLQKGLSCKVNNNVELPTPSPPTRINVEKRQGKTCEGVDSRKNAKEVREPLNEVCFRTVNSVTKEVEALKCFIGELTRDLLSVIEEKKVSAGAAKEVIEELSVSPLYLTRTNGKAEPKIWKPRERDSEDLLKEASCKVNNLELLTPLQIKHEEYEGKSCEGIGSTDKELKAEDSLSFESGCSKYPEVTAERTIQQRTDDDTEEQPCKLTYEIDVRVSTDSYGEPSKLPTSIPIKHEKNKVKSCQVEENKREEHFTAGHKEFPESSTVEQIIREAIELAVEQLGEELRSHTSSNYDNEMQRLIPVTDVQMTDVKSKSLLRLELSSNQLLTFITARELGIFIVIIIVNMFLIIQHFFISII